MPRLQPAEPPLRDLVAASPLSPSRAKRRCLALCNSYEDSHCNLRLSALRQARVSGVNAAYMGLGLAQFRRRCYRDAGRGARTIR